MAYGERARRIVLRAAYSNVSFTPPHTYLLFTLPIRLLSGRCAVGGSVGLCVCLWGCSGRVLVCVTCLSFIPLYHVPSPRSWVVDREDDLRPRGKRGSPCAQPIHTLYSHPLMLTCYSHSPSFMPCVSVCDLFLCCTSASRPLPQVLGGCQR